METKMALNRMFILLAISQPIASACFNTITEDMVQLWHCRYGHLSFKGLKTLQQKKMPEAVNWTVHVLNQSPTVAVKNKTSEEAWSGVKPSVEHFRVFGCISHVHVPDSKRTKLDDKSLSCVLLGVSEESKAYRLYDPVSQRIITSRDVVFEEDKNWDWGKKYEESIVSELEWGDLEEEATMFDDNEEGNEVDPNEEGSESESDPEANVEAVEGNFSSDSLIEESSPSSNEGRNRRPPIWMRDYETGEGISEEDNEAHLAHLAMFATIDPIHFEDAVKSEKWRKAMDLEMESIKNNGTWELTKLPKEAKKHGVDYTEVFAPVARMETIRLVAALAVQKGWTIYQLDVKSAFLHGELNEVVFVEQPCGYVQKGNEQKVYRLKKALYGLKQAPRAWYSRIEAYFMKEGFEKCDYEHTLFIKTSKEGKVLIVSLYVDDLIFTGNDELMFTEFKNSMKHEFDMTDLGKMRYFLGLEVLQRSDGVFISQKKYALEVLKQFGMDKSNFVHNPIVPSFKLMKDEGGVKVDNTYYKQIVGSLMYLIATRPDMMFVVSLISRYMENPTELHLQAAKRVLRYLKGTTEFGIFYKKRGDDELAAYTDSDYAGDLEDRKKLTKAGTVELVHCGTQEQLADVMTKPLKLDVFLNLRGLLGVCSEMDIN
ncbi:Retrovirus-related Pol polyprotein from transposon TNT 1-94 [Vitis vinifera]|uniref:Retrovirus-related Pol polyprotein from transposon TNT 1-94 n=1 Tax=Vitis vinifera TaxID=29760 RepID=A0A438C7H9_VITVI|nr:Retrovirus-related Pol polyprotein from transposon TNT 1-94 [Vitis vinifera]